ncbi:hypothetical protein [Azospirillum brasilense]|uniref:hypothetical protein n=1 Tax=Azospirillum brasilense TaxID=192 RepID=UPI0011C3D7E6|nr:hypothetical protein [Azospirillum brasilense]NUB25737.1 hypothetical protein [Azospirillum brasilense]NUB33875.1 hypothetical protein [Azospirillum brasilense]
MNRASNTPSGGQMLYGYRAIAGHLGLTERQSKHLVETGRLRFPEDGVEGDVFKVGHVVCALVSSLERWKERAARGELSAEKEPGHEHSPEGEDA